MKTISRPLSPAFVLAALALPVAAENHERPRTPRPDTPAQVAQTPLGTLTRLSDVIGLEVRNRQDEKLGKVDDLVLDLAAGRVVSVVVSSGGLLGVGDRLRVVPPAALHHDEARRVLYLDVTKESFEAAPAFEAARWDEFRREPAGVVRAYQHHGVTPYFSHGPVKADNSALNRRDRDGRTLTPLDQGGGEADTALTARIRQDIMARPGLSLAAQNVKIITVHGRVTLRGPVESDEERRVIGEVAAAAAPVGGGVDNQLEVRRP
jgi:osmotically-inducible protein OsmY